MEQINCKSQGLNFKNAISDYALACQSSGSMTFIHKNGFAAT